MGVSNPLRFLPSVRALWLGYPHGLPQPKTNKYDSVKY